MEAYPHHEGSTFYRTGDFAKRASVSLRTLRFYDHEGLLSPSHRTESGHRFYSDEDLATLQQILALKFLGFSLREIRAFLAAEPEALQEALSRQQRMLEDQRAQLDAILGAIDRTRARLAAGEASWDSVAEIIEVIQMEKKQDWVNNYFTPEQNETMRKLSDASYSDKAKEKMAQRPTWTEEDQKRADAEYAKLAAELKRLVAQGADPASEEAQAAAAMQLDLISQFTQNDPDIAEGLGNFWQDFNALPEDEKPPMLPWGQEEAAFLGEALRLYQGK